MIDTDEGICKTYSLPRKSVFKTGYFPGEIGMKGSRTFMLPACRLSVMTVWSQIDQCYPQPLHETPKCAPIAWYPAR
jgi:hypothetical protein